MQQKDDTHLIILELHIEILLILLLVLFHVKDIIVKI